MRHIVVETDLGHDPDDLFAILYIACLPDVVVDAIVIVPGDRDQLAVANLIRSRCLPQVLIGASKLKRDKYSSGGVHHKLLKKYGLPLEGTCDGSGDDIISKVYRANTELFTIGPATSTGRFLRDCRPAVERATMQG